MCSAGVESPKFQLSMLRGVPERFIVSLSTPWTTVAF